MTTTRALLWIYARFGFAFLAAALMVRLLRMKFTFNAPFYWPLSIFRPRLPDLPHVIAIVGAVALWILIWRRREWFNSPARIIAVGLVLLSLSSLGQGLEGAFERPVSGAYGGKLLQYHHDAVNLPGTVETFREFNRIQGDLNIHSRSHPPGAVLVYHILHRLFDAPLVSGLSLFIVSTLLSGILLFRLFALVGLGKEAGPGVLFFFALPAVQIYYASSLDALIAASFLGTVVFFMETRSRSWALALLFLSLSFLLTFGALFLIPVLLWLDWSGRRSLRRSIGLGFGLLGVMVIWRIVGFDYLSAFLTASRFENPDGFRLISEPFSFIFTRLENMGEILLFLGPLAAVAIWRGLKTGEHQAQALGQASIVTLLAIFLTGAYHTGETARVCLFLPPLLLPALLQGRAGEPWRRIDIHLVFAQGLAMQLFGNFFW